MLFGEPGFESALDPDQQDAARGKVDPDFVTP
jgi:hypothetical protein